MKKFITFLIAALLLASCKEKPKDYVITITYRVYYPGNTVEKTKSIDVYESGDYILSSFRGSNSLTIDALGERYPKDCYDLESTTAPIEVVSSKITYKY